MVFIETLDQSTELTPRGEQRDWRWRNGDATSLAKGDAPAKEKKGEKMIVNADIQELGMLRRRKKVALLLFRKPSRATTRA